MNKEIKINKLAKSITFINNEIAFSQFEIADEILDLISNLQQENQQLKEKLNCKEYFSSTMPEDTEFVILTKNNYDRQQKDLTLENIKLKKQKADVVELIKKQLLSNTNITKYTDEMCLRDLLRMLGEIDE